MRVSVFTPSHDPHYLDDCYRSLCAQTYSGWEWIVVLNGKARDWRPPDDDDRVIVQRARRRLRGVGAYKRAACEQASGDILLELDHDDILLPDCLTAVAAAMSDHPDTVCAYSDFAQMDADGSPNLDRFDPTMGWMYSDEVIDRRTYLRCHSMVASPHNLGYIWYAPNHVRAFRHDAYEKVGGYNAELTVLDDQELMARLYLEGDFHHIPRCLYLQRVHRRNTQVEPETNAFIQEQTVFYYQQTVESMLLARCRRSSLAALRLVTPTSFPSDPEPGYEDVMVQPELPALATADDGAGVIKASDILQRMPDRAAFFNEIHRTLAHGGMLLTETPSTDGRGAFQDPSHVAFYNQNSFTYLTGKAAGIVLPTMKAELQISYLRTYYPSAWHEQMLVPYVQANLIALKDGPRQGGLLS